MTRTITSRLVGAVTLLAFVLATNYSTCSPQGGRVLTKEAAASIMMGHKGGQEQDIEHVDSLERPDIKTDHATATTTTEAAPTSTTTEPKTSPPRCNEANEFHCQIENRCVPLEWRCDFIQQCSSGQDEIGCVTDWCDFDRDLCYWYHKPNGNKRLEAAAHADSPSAPLTRIGYWRRYLPVARRLENPGSLVVDLLDSLSLNSAARAKYIFTPLWPEAGDLRALRDKHQSNNKLVKRARIATPQIGRTNSQCQMRFEFALWMVARPYFSSSLSLVAHSADTNTSRTLWTRTSHDHESAPGASAVNWTLGVAELGHLSRVELSFEAQLVANLPLDGQKSGSSTAGDLRETWLLKQRPAEAEQVAFEGAIVALRWLKFHNCRWPQGASIINSLDDNNNNRGQELPLEGLMPAAVDVLEQETCSKGEFQCSNGICVPKQRLCNFVDDCMSPSGPEDEAQSLCAPVASTSENFESTSMGSKHMQLFLTSRADKFWHLNGNWTINRTSIRSNPLSLNHLPRVDHTSHKSSGRFLSLEVPQAHWAGPQDNQQTFFWAAINSRWMQKAAALGEADECRVKFFYNLVSSGPRNLYQGTSRPPFKLSLVVEHHRVRARNESADDLLAEDDIEWVPAVRQVDAFFHSQTIERAGRDLASSQPEVVEYSGVDFWREANVPLLHLEPGDLFYIRLLVFVEFTGEPMGQHKASINLDDLSTHFGCGRTLELSADSPRQERHFDDQLLDLLRAKMSPEPTTLPHYSMRNRLKRFNYNHNSDNNGSDKASDDKPIGGNHFNSIRVEAEKLIVYVLGAFLVMMGVIAMIVFVVVPRVERAMMNYQDQIQLSISGDISDYPISQGTIYDLSAASSNARRTCRPRTWSFDSLTTSTGFSSAAAAANKHRSQYSIASSSDSSQDGHFQADTNLDHEFIGHSTIKENLNSQAQRRGDKTSGEMVLAAERLQPKSREELHEEFNTSSFFCVQDSSSFDGSLENSTSSWQVHSMSLYEPAPACDIRRRSGSGSRELTDTPDQHTTR